MATKKKQTSSSNLFDVTETIEEPIVKHTGEIVITKWKWNDVEVTFEEYQRLDTLWLESTKKPPPSIVSEKKTRKTK